MKILTYNCYGGHYINERRKYLRDIILKEDGDIVCLQEVKPDFIKMVCKDDQGKQIYEVCSTTREALGAARKLSDIEKKFLQVTGSLAILLKVDMFKVVSKRLVHEGQPIDTGQLYVHLKPLENREELPLFENICLYNIHFSGGTYGKPPEEVEEIRQARVNEYNRLCSDITRIMTSDLKKIANYCILIAGDFNSDTDQVEHYPEARGSPEIVFKTHENLNLIDLWDGFAGNQFKFTESTSKNTFRAYLKPRQQKEVRFDRIILGQPRTQEVPKVSIKLIGDNQIGQTKSVGGNDELVPLFPSDHFGIAALIS